MSFYGPLSPREFRRRERRHGLAIASTKAKRDASKQPIPRERPISENTSKDQQ